MPGFTCTCGHCVDDGGYPLAHRADILSSGDVQQFFDGPAQVVADLFLSACQGRAEEWLQLHFPPIYLESKPTLQDIIESLLMIKQTDLMRVAYQCEACGRLWLEVGPGTNRFHSFAPEADAPRDLLRSTTRPSRE